MQSHPVSNMTENDLKFEWLLCLASAVESSRRSQIRPQAEKFTATRPEFSKTTRDPNFERLLFLTSELQVSHHRRVHETGESRQGPGFPAVAATLAGE